MDIRYCASRFASRLLPLSSCLLPLASCLLLLSSCLLLLSSCLLLLSSCTFPGSVKPTVKIGLSAPFEGLYRDVGYEVLHAVRLAVRQRNEAGGVAGRYLVELVALNDFGEAEEAAQQVREMAADPGVLGLLGGWSPQTAAAAAPECQRLGLPFLTPDRDWAALADEAARLAAGAGRRAVVLHTADEQDQALAEAFDRAWTAQGGTTALLATPSDDEWALRLVRGRAQPPDVVFLAASAPTAADWLVALRQAGFHGLAIGGPELGSSLLVEIAGAASEGLVFVSPFPPVRDDPDFASAYRALSGGAPPGPLAEWAYGAANRLLEAIDAAAQSQGHPTPAAVRQALPAPPAAPHPIYAYVIHSGNPFTSYPPPSDY